MIRATLHRFAGRPQNVLALLSFAVYAAYSVSRYQQLLTAGYDLGIFDQVLRRYAHFQAPIVTLKGPGYNIFGDHFHPILATIAPLYWIWDDPRVLLIVQAGLIAISAAIVYRFAARYLSANVALMVMGAYALGWPLQALAHFDFHEIAFGVPLVAWAVDAIDRRSAKELIGSCVLLLLVREDMGLIVALLALIALPRVKRRYCVGLIALGAIGYYLVTSIVLPHFNPAGTFAYWSYDALGPDLPSALKSLLLHPLHGLNLFFTPSIKSITLLWLLLPVGFLALGSPYTLCCLPILAERFLASRENLWGTKFHYSAILWPFIMLGAIDAARRLKLLSRETAVRRVAVLMLLLPVVGTLSYVHLWPLNRAVTGKAFREHAKTEYQYALLKLIPHNTCVEAEDHLASHLTRWNKVIHPTRIPHGEDFIILDVARETIGYQMPNTLQMNFLARNLNYTVLAKTGTVLILRRPGYSGPRPECSPTAK